MKSLFGSRDVIVVLLLMLLLVAGWSGQLQRIGNLAYDSIRERATPPAGEVVVIAIDERSVASLDGYPASRELHFRVAQNLTAAGVRFIGYAAVDPGFTQSMADTIESSGASLVVGLPLSLAVDQVAEDTPVALPAGEGLQVDGLATAIASRPLPPRYTTAASRFAGVVVDPEPGGILRKTYLMVEHQGRFVPSLALGMYLAVTDNDNSELTAVDGRGLRVADTLLPTDSQLASWPYLQQPINGRQAAGVLQLSFHDVMHGNVDIAQLQDKAVIIGVTATGLVPMVSLPRGQVAPALVEALTLSSMLDGELVRVPGWATPLTMLVTLLAAGSLFWLRTRSYLSGVVITLIAATLLLAIEALLISAARLFVDLLPGVLMLVGGFLLLATVQPVARSGRKATSLSAEVHRRLGLASQKHGDLDAAFESFRKCPLDNSIMVLLYYLAQEFENDGRFDRAVAVYQYMESFDPNYKDIQERIEKARLLEETVLLEQARMPESRPQEDDESAPVRETGGYKQLGRYQVERKIGKGAMGLVYQGRDPKINRTVAIKTLNLKQEFDEDEMQNVLGRFFHEAEAAGRLHHPNIVTIYDAGEEGELAYIAMEFLTGSDLRVFTKPETLLPPLTVIKMGIKLADALHYAHQRDIIHRDIKAANVMYDPASGQLKITDFGIARLTDSRRTKTGMVLGTPSSMSPEQLRGQTLDGRTDLYSLGVLMFQLLTGRLPYKADSLTQLMYKITKEEPPDLLALRPDLQDNGRCIRDIIHKLLEKEADKRYQDGKKLARDLLSCAKKIAGRK